MYHGVIADLIRDLFHRQRTTLLVVASRVIEQSGMSSQRWLCVGLGSMPAACFFPFLFS